jgi:hypothetical protein
MKGSQSRATTRFLTNIIGGVHIVIWVHRILGMYKVKSRFVVHKCIMDCIFKNLSTFSENTCDVCMNEVRMEDEPL